MSVNIKVSSRALCEWVWKVETRGFEPPTSAVRGRRSPGLSYVPTGGINYTFVNVNAEDEENS